MPRKRRAAGRLLSAGVGFGEFYLPRGGHARLRPGSAGTASAQTFARGQACFCWSKSGPLLDDLLHDLPDTTVEFGAPRPTRRGNGRLGPRTNRAGRRPAGGKMSGFYPGKLDPHTNPKRKRGGRFLDLIPRLRFGLV